MLQSATLPARRRLTRLLAHVQIELVEVVDFFARPELFRRSGARVPRGVLLCGPPGTGKTLLARAVAGEARVTFLSLNASEFVEMFAGVGAARVRDLFAQVSACGCTCLCSTYSLLPHMHACSGSLCKLPGAAFGPCESECLSRCSTLHCSTSQAPACAACPVGVMLKCT